MSAKRQSFTVRDTVRDQLVMNDGHAQKTLGALMALMAEQGAIFRQGEGDALRGVVVRALTSAEMKALGSRVSIPGGLLLPGPLRIADVQDFAERRFDVVKLRKQPNSDDFEARGADFRADLAQRFISNRLIGLRPLSGVAYAPILRSDGSIVSTPGYHADSELWLVDSIPALTVPETPTRQDAMTAMQRLAALLAEHCFEQDVDGVAGIAQLMTVPLRASMQRVPLLVADAAYPRTGKDYLLATAALIGTGFRPTIFTLGETREEQHKRIGAALLLGAPVISLNNVNGRLASDELAAYLTEGGCITRAYATTGGAKWAPNGNTLLASGNNIMLAGDLPERGLVSRQDARMEFPGERAFSGSPHDDVRKDRAGYLSAVFTIARWALRGTDYAPPEGMAGFGGFDEFNRLIRGPLLVLTGIDPLKRSQSEMQTARQHVSERDLVDALASLMPVVEPFCVRDVQAKLRLHAVRDGEADPLASLRQRDLPYRLRRARGRRGSTAQLVVTERPPNGDKVAWYSLVTLPDSAPGESSGAGTFGDFVQSMDRKNGDIEKGKNTLGKVPRSPKSPGADSPAGGSDEGVDR